MKVNFKVSHRYAVSFLESAVEKKKLEKVYIDIQRIAKALESSRELQVALQSPVIKPEVKEKIIVQLFENKVDNETLNFVRFIISKRREDFLLSICFRFMELYDEHIGVAAVHVKTAFELTDEQKNNIRKKMEHILEKKVRVTYEIDNKLLGGFVARVSDTLYDASLRHQLDLLKNQFINANISLN